MRKIFLYILFCIPLLAHAQVGEHRSDFSIGFNGGYMLSKVSFTPKVTQDYKGGITGGFSMRYVCEKYFKTICSVYAEVNYASMGWKERILDLQDQPVINAITNQPEKYSRTINYIQIPIMAHLAWGRETKGFNFFINAGPQFGFFLSESTESNFEFENRNVESRASSVVAQDTMAVEHKFDYGIAAGAGIEYSIPKVGHFLLEGRYYYGLGNLYGDSKKDYFGSSNFGTIIVKLTYLFDLTKTKNITR